LLIGIVVTIGEAVLELAFRGMAILLQTFHYRRV
jgi:hypothetical protein